MAPPRKLTGMTIVAKPRVGMGDVKVAEARKEAAHKVEVKKVKELLTRKGSRYA